MDITRYLPSTSPGAELINDIILERRLEEIANVERLRARLIRNARSASFRRSLSWTSVEGGLTV